MQANPRIGQDFPADKRCCPKAARDDALRLLGDAPIQSQGHAPLAGLGIVRLQQIYNHVAFARGSSEILEL